MSYTENIWLFFLLLAGIIIVPGMDMMLVLTNALTGGRRSGLAATSGIIAGGAAHTLFGAVGVSILAATFPMIFHVLLFAGAAYMVSIGVTLLRSSISVDVVDGAPPVPLLTLFRQGVLTCVLNPKAYLFTSAVYPQFLRPEYGNIPLQALAMGLLTAGTQLAIYGGLAFAAGGSRDFLTTHHTLTKSIGRGAGVLFIVVACITVWHALRSA